MALSVLSWAAKVCLVLLSSISFPQLLCVQVILAQADRDTAILGLLQKMGDVYSFITEDKRLHQISSMHTVLGQISDQILECAHFIRDYSKTKNFCEFLQVTALFTVSIFYYYRREQNRKEHWPGDR
jgi:hypothetical protein